MDYDVIAQNIKEYFEKKHANIKVQNVEFQRGVSFTDHGKSLYELNIRFEVNMDMLSLFSVPNRFRSSLSFENCFEKAKILIAAYYEAYYFNDEDKIV